MKLKELLTGISVLECTADPELEIKEIFYDSRKVTPGSLFVAVSGFAADGNKFIPMAAEKGAAAVVTAKKPETDIPYVLVESDRLALALLGREPMILRRSESYIGTLIDDLVTKGTQEPYRIMTSRSEYRLLLRQDNADRRLTPIGYRLGLVPEERMQAVREKYEAVDREIRRLEHTGIPGSEGLNRLLAERGSAPVTDGARLIDLLRRPQMTYRELMTFDPGAPALPVEVAEQVEISVKYEGYIRRQEKQVEELRQLEKHRLPPDMEYSHIQGLRLEAREKLAAVRPLDLGQASRISGVSPADIAALMIWLHTRTERGDAT